MDYLVKYAVLSISLLIIITASTVSPALGEISKDFPMATDNTIKLILTLPSFVIVPISLFISRFSNKFSKRKLIVLGLIIFLFGGIGGGLAPNIISILIFRGILGIGMGILTPFTTSLIGDFYDGDERREMMGYSNAVSNLGGIIAALLAGWLAIYNWRYVFGIYSLALIVLILVIIGLPEPPKRREDNKRKVFLNLNVIYIAILAFLLNVAFYGVVTNISLFITNEGMGNSGYSGIAMSSLTLAGFLSGILLDRISDILKKFKCTVGMGFMALGYFILSKSYIIPTVLIGTFMIGFGLGILKPLLFLNVTKVTPKFSNAFALSIVNSAILLGKFTSPYILDLVGEFLGNTDLRFIFSLVSNGLNIGVILSLIHTILILKVFKPRYSE